MNKYYYVPTDNAKSPLWKEGCLADIIEKYQKAFGCKEFQHGPFKFLSKHHDTGCSVSVKINIPNHPEREIICATYWYSGNYQFNTSKFECGAWDSALENEIDLIWGEAKWKIAESEKEQQQLIAARLKKEEDEKRVYEQYFLDGPK